MEYTDTMDLKILDLSVFRVPKKLIRRHYFNFLPWFQALGIGNVV